MVRFLLLIGVSLVTCGCYTFGPNYEERKAAEEDVGVADMGDAPDFSECAVTGDRCGSSEKCGPLAECVCGVCDAGTWSWVGLSFDDGAWHPDGGTFTIEEGTIQSPGGGPDQLDVSDLESGPNDVDDWKVWVSAPGDLLLFASTQSVHQIWAVKGGVDAADQLETTRLDLRGVQSSGPGTLANVVEPKIMPTNVSYADGQLTLSGVTEGLDAIGSVTRDQRVGVFLLSDAGTPAGIALAVRRSSTPTSLNEGRFVFSWIRDGDQPESIAGSATWDAGKAVFDPVIPESTSLGPWGLRDEGPGSWRAEGEVSGNPVSVEGSISKEQSRRCMVASEMDDTGLLFFFRPLVEP